MKDLNKTIKLSPTDFATLAICAIRYCHGRQTYMPSLVQSIIRPHLQELDDRDLSVMLNDCEGMREFDFGDPAIDRPHWEKWREDLLKEKERRNGTTESNRNPGTFAGAGTMGTADHKRNMGGIADGD